MIQNLTHFVKFSFSSMLGWGSSHTFGGGTSLIWYELNVTPVIITICILNIYVFTCLTLADCVNCGSSSLRMGVMEIRSTKKGNKDIPHKKSLPQLNLWCQWLFMLLFTSQIFTYILISHLRNDAARSRVELWGFNISLSLYLI